MSGITALQGYSETNDLIYAHQALQSNILSS